MPFVTCRFIEILRYDRFGFASRSCVVVFLLITMYGATKPVACPTALRNSLWLLDYNQNRWIRHQRSHLDVPKVQAAGKMFRYFECCRPGNCQFGEDEGRNLKSER